MSGTGRVDESRRCDVSFEMSYVEDALAMASVLMLSEWPCVCSLRWSACFWNSQWMKSERASEHPAQKAHVYREKHADCAFKCINIHSMNLSFFHKLLTELGACYLYPRFRTEHRCDLRHAPAAAVVHVA